MKKEELIKLNERCKTKSSSIRQSDKDKQNSSCNSCGICSKLRSPRLSSEGISSALSYAKAVGKESCVVSFMQSNYGNHFNARVLNPNIQKKHSNKGHFEPIACHSEHSEESQKTRDSSVVALPQNDIIGQFPVPLAISYMPAINRKCSCEGGCAKCKGEEEAERVSMSIMRMPSTQYIAYSHQLSVISHKPYTISYTPDANNGEQAQISEIMSNKGSGQRLDDNTRAFMEQRFGYDFSQVRVHADSYAASKSNELNAEAFTIGRDVFFNAGRYNPSTMQGKTLLAHELTHVVQQEKVPVNNIQKTNGESYSYYTIGGTTYYTSYFTVGESIVEEARNRMNIPTVRRAYSSEISWFFTRNPDLSGFTTEEQARKGWKKDTMCNEMPELGCEYSGRGRDRRFVRWTNYPTGEGTVWWGSNVYTCNVFIYNVLYNVGLNPPLMGNKHYFDPSGTYNRIGTLANYFDDIPADQIQPGDIFATTSHMEIITSTLRESEVTRGGRKIKVKTFSSIGAGADGIGVEEESGVRVTGKRFRRVKT